MDYSPVVVLGFVCTLLIIGKVIHFKTVRNQLFLGFIALPPAVMSGVLGICSLAIIKSTDPVLAGDLQDGLERLVSNFHSFIFSSLILGLHSTADSAQANQSLRGIMMSILHEGLPMIVYSQILVWGHSCCCILIIWIAGMMSVDTSLFEHYAALVPQGAETGQDVLLSSKGTKYQEDTLIVSESESLGLMITLIAGITLLSVRPYLQAQGWMAAAPNRARRGGSRAVADLVNTLATSEEVFGRRPRSVVNIHTAYSSSGSANHSPADKDKSINTGASSSSSASPLSLPLPVSSAASPQLLFHTDGIGVSSASVSTAVGGIVEAGLGAHIALIAFTAFLSFGVMLGAHILEIKLLGNIGTVFTGIRMFKLAMFLSLFTMLWIRKYKVSFKREWFMLLCGLFLDIVIVACLAKSLLRPRDVGHTHYMAIGSLISVMLLWNVLCYIIVARHIFPNFKFERALVLSASAMGNSYSGLLFARLMDPTLQSPVPAAFGAKLLLFFVPSSAAKNKIVTKFLEDFGLPVTFAICSSVLCTWYLIFKSQFNYNSSTNNINNVNESSDGSKFSDGLQNENLDTMPLLSASGVGGGGDGANEGSGRGDSSALFSTDKSSTYDHNRRQHAFAGDSGLGCVDDEEAMTGMDKRGIAMNTMGQGKGQGKEDNSISSAGLGADINIQMVQSSSIASMDAIYRIAAWLPSAQRSRRWDLKYSLVRDGASMASLLSQCKQRRNYAGNEMTECYVLLVEDSMGCVFGAYIAHGLENSAQYYGSGESFVFKLTPSPKVYRWTKENHMFFLSDRTHLAIGGGGDGFALQLDEDLDTGVSTCSATYRNDMLSSGEFFRVLNVEVFSLQLAR